MNDSYRGRESYCPRWIESPLRAAIQHHPVVVLTGARQVGKSTLLLHAEPFRSWRFVTLDDVEILRQAREAPASLWATGESVVVDEVQRAPELLIEIKRAVDNDPKRRFVVSGSANLLLMHQVSESLAGRAVYMQLAPMTIGEAECREPSALLARALAGELPADGVLDVPAADPVPLMLRGMMPALLRFDTTTACTQWWDGYTSTYLERDLRQLARIEALLDFRRVMELAALRTGQLVNQSDLARDAGLSQPSVHRYLNLLESSHLFTRLPPYLANRTTRLVKAPKAMWVDPGLAIFLSRYWEEAELRSARELGRYFEALVFMHLAVMAQLMTPPARISYWRTRRGEEVDLVVEHGRRVVAIEVKLSPEPRFRDAAGLRAFLDAHPEAAGGLLVHTGAEVRRLGERIAAVPWQMLT